MKKYLLSFVLMAAVCSAFAQKNQWSLSFSNNSTLERRLGNYSDGSSFDVLGSGLLFLIDPIAGIDNFLEPRDYVTNKKTTGGNMIQLGYLRAVDPDNRVWFGATYARVQYQHSKYWSSGRVTATRERFATLMTRASVVWYRNNWLELSTGAGLGLTRQKTVGFIRENRMLPAAQFSPVKANLKFKNVGVFVEPGIGTLGIQGGVNARF